MTPDDTSRFSRLRRDWLPVASLGLAAFIFVTTELLPVGLLPDIAAGLNRPEAQTGLLLTAYAWMVTITSLPLTLLSARFDRRKLLLILLGVFCAAHMLAALAWNFSALMAARIIIALAHALFWSIVTPLAGRVAPPGGQGRALGLIVSGVSLAAVLGMPLGTLVGHILGWRLAFAAVGLVALGTAVVLVRLLPSLPSQNAGTMSDLPALLRHKSLLRVYALTLITVTGHFTAFTYLTPFFLELGKFSAQTVVLLLLLLGGAGLPSSFWGSLWVDRKPRAAVLIPLALLVGCLILLPAATEHGFAPAALACLIWGAALPALTLALQTRVLQLAPNAADMAISIYSGTFNIGIGGGAALGSLVFAGLGIPAVAFVGAAFFALALALAAVTGKLR